MDEHGHGDGAERPDPPAFRDPRPLFRDEAPAAKADPGEVTEVVSPQEAAPRAAESPAVPPAGPRPFPPAQRRALDGTGQFWRPEPLTPLTPPTAQPPATPPPKHHARG